MKTLEEIRKETEDRAWTTIESMMILAVSTGNYKLINKIINEFAVNVAKEALNNASENARLYDGVSLLKEIQYIDEMGYDVGVTIDKQSILNESNIPKL